MTRELAGATCQGRLSFAGKGLVLYAPETELARGFSGKSKIVPSESVSQRELAAGAGLGFCITLYNEPWAQLRATLMSILASLPATGDAEDTSAFICIVADGRDRMAPDVIEAMIRLGLVRHDPETDSEMDVHLTEHVVRNIAEKLQPSDATRIASGTVTIAVCAKYLNRGKLHSHEIFFERICARFSPRTCFQLDAGTVLLDSAVRTLDDSLRRQASIGAIAPCITPPCPESDSSLLYAWQFHDFALRQAALLPVESMCGFLGVMPGQASAFRWRALRSRDQNRERDQPQDPLWAYLYGIAASSPLRRLMYLSEDRVIGSAIVLDTRNTWRLKYAPQAAALTDHCDTFGELFRQRRRWTNSAMVCRLWLLRRWKTILAHPIRSLSDRVLQTFSLLLQCVIGVREFLAPTQLAALLFVLGKITVDGSTGVRSSVAALLSVATLDLILSGLATRSRSGPSRRLCRALAPPVAWGGAALFIFVLLTSLSLVALTVVLLPALLVFACMLIVLPRRTIPLLARTHFSPIQYAVLSNAILAYSLWNMHDSSWGTKGLTSPKEAHAADVKLRRFRWQVLLTWVAANAAALAVATRPGIISPQLNPVTEIVSVFELVIASSALVWLIVYRMRSHRIIRVATAARDSP